MRDEAVRYQAMATYVLLFVGSWDCGAYEFGIGHR